jgi:hypothetical protein
MNLADYVLHNKYSYFKDKLLKNEMIHERLCSSLLISHAVNIYKGKQVKLSVCLTNYALRHEGVWESECIDPYFLDLGTNWR